MKQFVLVAGVDFEFAGVDFRTIADSRRKFLTARNRAKEDLRFTTMDVRKGEVEVRNLTFPGGKRTEAVSRTTPFDPVSPANYTTSGGHTRFKPNQPRVMSITDVYATVRSIGHDDPGTLAELSVFSHGWMGGPILVNSVDDRRMDVTFPTPIGPLTFSVPVAGTLRDPDDKDGRPGLDFRAPTMDATALDLFQKAYAADGISWLWGCAFPRVVHHTLWAMEHAPTYRSSGLGDDDVLKMDAVTPEDVAFLDSLLAPLIGTFPAPRSSVTVKFKFLKHAFCLASQACYATALADGSKKPVHAALLGTYAEYDTGGDMLMHVVPSLAAHTTFYKNYLGFTVDPERRGYGVFTPGRTCPVPSVP